VGRTGEEAQQLDKTYVTLKEITGLPLCSFVSYSSVLYGIQLSQTCICIHSHNYWASTLLIGFHDTSVVSIGIGDIDHFSIFSQDLIVHMVIDLVKYEENVCSHAHF
jgi:hypothetical protein